MGQPDNLDETEPDTLSSHLVSPSDPHQRISTVRRLSRSIHASSVTGRRSPTFQVPIIGPAYSLLLGSMGFPLSTPPLALAVPNTQDLPWTRTAQ